MIFRMSILGALWLAVLGCTPTDAKVVGRVTAIPANATSIAHGVRLDMVAGPASVSHAGSGWITLTLTNVAGKDLAMYYTPLDMRLRFNVVDDESQSINNLSYPKGSPIVQGSTYFPAGEQISLNIPISDYVDITKPGLYYVRAIMRVSIAGRTGDTVLVSGKVAVRVN